MVLNYTHECQVYSSGKLSLVNISFIFDAYLQTHEASYHLPNISWRGASQIKSFLGYPDDLRIIPFAKEPK